MVSVSAAARKTLIRDFDGRGLFAALDDRRQAEGLSWPEAATAIFEMSPALNAAREAAGKPNHPIAAATIRNLEKRGDTSCQHALFFLRWLERTPESFLLGAGRSAGVPLPAGDADRRPRWNLKATHAALAEQRTARALTWAQAAKEIGVTPSQLTGLSSAKFAMGMAMAMRVTQWLGRPAADFVYLATW